MSKPQQVKGGREVNSQKRYRCVFYPRLSCPVRKAMAEAQTTPKITVEPQTDEDKVVSKLVKALAKAYTDITSPEYTSLSYFCHQCVKKEHMDRKYREKTGLVLTYPHVVSGPVTIEAVSRKPEGECNREDR